MRPPSAATAAPTIETQAEEAFLIDAETGAVLLDKNADQPMPPSSMSKLMTAYIVFDRLQEQRLSLEDKFTVSEKAWRMGGSKMIVEVGSQEIGRAHVCTPVPNANLVCRLLLAQKK